MDKKQAQESKRNTNKWITTYTDLMTLLLTFFVLLLSMSVRDEIRTRKALDSLVGAFGLLPGGRSPLGKSKGTDVRDPAAPILPSKPVNFEMLKELTVTNELNPYIQILKRKQKLIISIDQRVLFTSGSLQLKPEILQYLRTLAEHLRHSKTDIEIRGHAGRYENLQNPDWVQQAWILSTKRAQLIHQFFLQQGIAAERMSAHGFSYFQPIVDDLVFPDLRDKNQRVEIMLGADSNVPSQLFRREAKAKSYINYKDFIFKVLP